MKFLFSTFLLLGAFCCNSVPLDEVNKRPMDSIENIEGEINKDVKISMALLEATKSGNDISFVLTELAALDLDQLVSSLNTKQKKLAFWMNIYNGLVQYELVSTPALFEDRGNFYKEQRHKIAGIDMSYDDIEHGIIRNSRVKLGLGYLKRIFVDKWERKLRNTDIDGRVHFALNCGAKDCPPIAIFNDVALEDQLTKIATAYLIKHTSIEADVVTTSPLFSWFRGDFGGTSGVLKLLIERGVVPQGKYSLEFKSYDWTLDTGNYTEL